MIYFLEKQGIQNKPFRQDAAAEAVVFFSEALLTGDDPADDEEPPSLFGDDDSEPEFFPLHDSLAADSFEFVFFR